MDGLYLKTYQEEINSSEFRGNKKPDPIEIINFFDLNSAMDGFQELQKRAVLSGWSVVGRSELDKEWPERKKYTNSLIKAYFRKENSIMIITLEDIY